MKDWSADWSALPTYPAGAAGRGVFRDLWDLIEAYYRQDPQPQLGIGLNYERVLGQMVALASWASPPPFGNTLSQAVRDPAFSSAFTWPEQENGEPYFHRHLITDQLGDLIGRLAGHLRQRCLAVDEASPPFADYAAILRTLAERFDVGVYNLNYDNLALRALPGSFTGFEGGAFRPEVVINREEWNFVYHLHGSVHHSLTGSSQRQTIVWQDDLTGTFTDSAPLMISFAAEFRPVFPATLVAGGFKLDQMLAEPAQTLFASMTRHVQQADAFLIAGYGFGDFHVNRALQNRFALAHNANRGRPNVVVVTKTNRDGLRMADRQGRDYLAWEVTHTLATRFATAEATPAPPWSLAEMIDHGHFETDYWGRARIWHGGFSELAGQAERLVEALTRS